jgi:hypothetical protein
MSADFRCCEMKLGINGVSSTRPSCPNVQFYSKPDKYADAQGFASC